MKKGLLLIGIALVASTSEKAVRPRIDPRAEAEVRKMCKYLLGLKSFRVESSATEDLVLPSKQKIEHVSEWRLEVERPDKLRIEREGTDADTVFLYDGKQFVLYGKMNPLYATFPAPSGLDGAIDVARNRLGIDTPGSDLLFTDSYEGLMKNVVSGSYLGIEPIHGTPCHHAAFHGRVTDFQIWIEDGDRPVPRRYVITSAEEPATPDFVVELSSWEPNAELPADLFSFKAQADWTKIQFITRTPTAWQIPGEPPIPMPAYRTTRGSVRPNARYAPAVPPRAVTKLPEGCIAGVRCGSVVYQPFFSSSVVVFVPR